MTLPLIISSPSNAPYGARVQVKDEKPVEAASRREGQPDTEYVTTAEHMLDPGQCVEVYITETRMLSITEYHLPVIPDACEEPSTSEATITINEEAHGHE